MKQFWRKVWKYRLTYLLILPGILFFIIFHYLPMFGIIVAFKDVKPFHSISYILSAPWVGLKHFKKFLNSYYFWNVMENTLTIGAMRVFLSLPCNILMAILINELRSNRFKKAVQTISYLPHFISVVVLASLVTMVTSMDGGLLNAIIEFFGGEPINFRGDERYFRWTIVLSGLWKEVGWGAIIYLAAITGINQELYEAGELDGCNRLQRIWYITIPSMAPTISIMAIMSVTGFINAGFEDILLMYSPAVYSVGDIIDTYVYREGLANMNYSYSVAVNLFKSVISAILLLSTNWFAKKMDQPGIW